MINARRFIQASEILRKASNYFVKKYVNINTKTYNNNISNINNINNISNINHINNNNNMNEDNISRNNIIQ